MSDISYLKGIEPYYPSRYYSNQTFREKLNKKWRSNFDKQVKLLNNEQLLDEYAKIHAGDDWEGNFTEEGRVLLEVLDTALRARLVECGFLT